MTTSSTSGPGRRLPSTHPMFAALFADWHEQSGALSALPDAPVVLDRPRRRISLRRPVRSPDWRIALWSRLSPSMAGPGARDAGCTGVTTLQASAGGQPGSSVSIRS